MHQGMSGYVFFRQNFALPRLPSSLRIVAPGGGAEGSGGPELRRKSARSFVVDRLRVSVVAASRAWSRGLCARGALEVTVEEMIAGCAEGSLAKREFAPTLGAGPDGGAPGGGCVPFLAARAFAAATVSGLRRKGVGALLPPPDGSMLLRKSIMLSSL